MQLRTENQLKTKLLERFEVLVRELYATGDARSNTEEWRKRDDHLSGFIDAIAVSELIDMHVLQETIDRIHLEVFGESRLERRRRLQKLQQSAEEMNWKQLDTPAFERNKSRKK
jgi:hypothetical protein